MSINTLEINRQSIYTVSQFNRSEWSECKNQATLDSFTVKVSDDQRVESTQGRKRVRREQNTWGMACVMENWQEINRNKKKVRGEGREILKENMIG